MHTITIELQDENAYSALRQLENQNLIKIVSDDSDSYALPGKPISNVEFLDWIKDAENDQTLTLSESKIRWEHQKKKIEKLIQ